MDEHVLIPRPETEELVKWVLSDFKDAEDHYNVLELGTGSGCIAIVWQKSKVNSILKHLEVSEAALGVAQKNALHHNVEIDFIYQDMRELEVWDKPLNIMISNPPYIEPDEKKEMLPNVLDYEPHLALFTPENEPLYFYKKIILLAQSGLDSNGCLYLEINPKFEEDLLTFIKNSNF